MTQSPISVGNVQAATQPRFDPQTGEPLYNPEEHKPDSHASVGTGPKHAQSDSGQFIAPTIPPKNANPYAPTGWRQKVSVEFDVMLPSGQLCRVRRLDRNDIIKLRIIDHLDTLLPKLIDMDKLPAEEQRKQITKAVSEDVNLIDNVYTVIDVVVMACCVKPLVTNNKDAVLYGTPADWEDPNFISIVHLDDIDMEDRQVIFGYAFGGDGQDLKSLATATSVMEFVPTSKGIQLPTEPPS